MTNNYFEKDLKTYFEEKPVKPIKPKEDIQSFDISTEKYSKTNMKVEILEYEIKD